MSIHTLNNEKSQETTPTASKDLDDLRLVKMRPSKQNNALIILPVLQPIASLHVSLSEFQSERVRARCDTSEERRSRDG